MKKYIIIIIAITLVCVGCYREKRGKLTQRGKEIHDSWLMYSQEMIEKTIVPVFQMDAWIGGNDSIRRIIEDNYFPYLRVREEATNEFAFYDGAQKILTVNTNGYALADNGASWLVSINNARTYESDYGQIPMFLAYPSQWRLFISKTGNQQWNISLDTTRSMGSKCDWKLGLPANDTIVYFSQQEFSLAGNGTFKYAGDVYLRYHIDETLQHQGNQYPWNRGVVSMIARFIDPETNEIPIDDIHVKAEYTGDGIKITYRNITETWEFEKRH